MRMFSRFSSAIYQARQELRNNSHVVKPKTWQSIDVSRRPEFESTEVMWFGMRVPILPDIPLEQWQRDIGPNLPWADNHFKERVSGYPLNPGTEWANWPWGKSADGFRQGDMFNHTYAERYWPKYATKYGPIATVEDAQQALAKLAIRDIVSNQRGIRYDYGDLGDVVNQLIKDPLTRQAVLPVFFPEDTGAVHGDRVPCSLFYHFIIRDDRLDLYYYLRSCDFIRHFRDDIYLTLLLQMWVVEQLSPHMKLTTGSFIMQIGSLHIFKNDLLSL